MRPGVELEREAGPQRVRPERPERRVDQDVRRVGRPAAGPDEAVEPPLELLAQVRPARLEQPGDASDTQRVAAELRRQLGAGRTRPRTCARCMTVASSLSVSARRGVDEHALDGGARDPADLCHLAAEQLARRVHADARRAARRRARRPGRRPLPAPGRRAGRGGRRATGRTGAARGPQARTAAIRRASAVAARVPDGVDAPVLPVEATGGDAPLELRRRDPETPELPGRHAPVLPGRELREHDVGWSDFTGHRGLGTPTSLLSRAHARQPARRPCRGTTPFRGRPAPKLRSAS